MARVKFLKYKQSDFLTNVKEHNGLKWSDLAKICGVKNRTLFDWRRDKYQMSHLSFKKLKSRFKEDIPKKIEVLSDTWHIVEAGRLGAYARNSLYGSPATAIGRRKGGLVTTAKFRDNPSLAKKLGFVIKKPIKIPLRSPQLAEFIGIVLGDGSIREYQTTISTNAKTDRPYSYYIRGIIKKLFGIKLVRITPRPKNALDITTSSKNLVDFLIKCGLKKGDKIYNQVNIPYWILKNREFSKRCVRGLMDTDGGIFFHKHKTKGIYYRNVGLCFTSHSKPLLNSFHKILLDLEINAKSDNVRHVYVYGRKEIAKYMNIVGSSNIKHIKRFRSYKGSSL